MSLTERKKADRIAMGAALAALAALYLRASELFPGPDSASLRAEWVRAVGVVRASPRGWILDPGTPRPAWGWRLRPASAAKP